jgi:hypothetical protein
MDARYSEPAVGGFMKEVVLLVLKEHISRIKSQGTLVGPGCCLLVSGTGKLPLLSFAEDLRGSDCIDVEIRLVLTISGNSEVVDNSASGQASRYVM